VFGFHLRACAQLDEVCFGWQTAGPVFRHGFEVLRHGEDAATYLNGLNSTLHFLSMWHQESGAKKFAQQFGQRKRKRVLSIITLRMPSVRMLFLDLTKPPSWSWTAAERGRPRRFGTGGRQARSGADDSGSGFGGILLQRIYRISRFHRNSDEWKVMGLAPYGRPGVDLSAFIV